MSTPDEQQTRRPDELELELEPEAIKDLDVGEQDAENIHGGHSVSHLPN